MSLAAGETRSYQYTLGPGVRTLRFISTDVDGLQTEQNFTAVVHERYAMDQALRLLWSGFTAALTTGQRGQAMTFLSTTAQAKYGPVFDTLGEHLPQVFADFSAPTGTDLTTEVSEYLTVRTIDGEEHLYFIYFTRGYDGIWRLDSM